MDEYKKWHIPLTIFQGYPWYAWVAGIFLYLSPAVVIVGLCWLLS